MALLQRLRDVDSKLSLWMYNKGLSIPRGVLHGLEHAGNGLFWIVPAAIAIWYAPHISFTEKQEQQVLRSFLVALAVGFFVDLALVGIIKLLVRRPRPIYNAKGMFLVVSADHWSFPSGHSSRAMLVAALFWMHVDFWWSLLVSLWAFNTVLSRVVLGRHFCFDVLAGSVLGFAEALAICRFLVAYDVVDYLFN